MNKIIDGKETAKQIRTEIKEEVLVLKEKYGKVPGLAVVIVGEDPASKVYVNSKVRACEELGIYSEKHVMKAETTEIELLELVDSLNKNENIHGILVQLPLPKGLNSKLIIDSIAKEKDVDGFHAENIGKVLIGEEDTFKSCTPYGVVELLKRYELPISGQDIVIVGRSNIVGKPLAALLINESATVQVCHSRTKNLEEKVKQADIVVAAVGIAKFIKGSMIKDGAVVIDVGINRLEDGTLCGDVDYEQAKEKASYITPVPGGVGPMTIAMLMKNTLISFERTMK
ncbi:MAG: bifunctional methylenetetrahydrofolate dehydrogenase/methenyltetrahydrofolate cyclohydrolase FolD [Fusobacteriaceae bacterium]|nr:bifunctional methylenetetrahydrofolate dehydrogenase/methenyltetrahydrofolate cyclohydrolase FolD [Fusobacteriaceae bacterium]MBN2837730.1 bifunctional methylenetetrahydrofolate dehydrogenase/methenyltetrahydrofolate cyclohydrolase FolD [Fusobacteriaceae bacterium]